MKTLSTFRNAVAVALCLAVSQVSSAQTWDEWFKQDKTQIKYLTRQIAKLQFYLNHVKKGYIIIQKGTALISDIKKGDFNLHNSFFNGLQVVNPAIKKYARIGDILLMQAEVMSAYRKFYGSFKEKKIFSDPELDHLYRVFTSLLDDVASDIEMLTILISDRNLEMSDDERITQIDKLYHRMGAKRDMLLSFCRKIELQSLQRQRELFEIEALKKLY